MAKIELPGERKVKHLTLIREPRTITPQEFNALSFAERLEMVRVSDSEFRYRLLTEARDGGRIMERLSGQDVYLMLKEIGTEAVELVLPMISPDQFTFCLDLDCWNGDRIDSVKALQWIEQLFECEEEKILQIIREMNFELLVLILKMHVTVLHGPDDIDEDDVRIEAMRRDGGYEFDFKNGEESKLFIKLFEVLFRSDPGFYTYLIESVRGEHDSLLTESVYHQRTGRLHDAGFPDPLEARAIYSWIEPEEIRLGEGKLPMQPSEDGVAQPAFMLIEANPRDLLASALAECLTPSANWELACLANKILLADGVDLDDRPSVRDSLGRMYETFNLALEYLCDDKAGAVELLKSTYFQHLFQVGYNLKIRLQRRANKLLKTAAGPFFDPPYKQFLEALGRKQPHYFTGLDDPAETVERNFRSAIDLVRAEKWLDMIERQRRLFADRLPFDLPSEESFDLAGCKPEQVEDLTLSRLFLTALANRVLGRDFGPEPLAAEELPGLHGMISQVGKLDSRLREETVAWIETLVEGSGGFADWCLDIWELEFCSVDPERIDPRFIGGLLVRFE
ncbi:MAG: hypothetical protein C0623_11260 [Desulfuromonas sp.]|nr:MAG: hypothetical protein C0623_11260 [Desulfuromonas sp.]